MRLQLNLNQYYSGLDQMQVNTLFSLFVNMKYSMRSLESMTKKLKNGDHQLDEFDRRHYLTVKRVSLSCLKAVNEYMISIGKDAIFKGIENPNIDEIDYEAIVNQYNYLMSKPEQESKEA